MAKKQQQAQELEENYNDGTTGEVDTDFDLDDDFKPEPLMRKGWYKGRVSEVSYNDENACIQWKVALDENGGYMSDGETPIDGSVHNFFNWLPKASDKEEFSKTGKNKWQNKINMLKKFAEGMRINMKTMAIIQNEIAEQNWVGMPVSIELKAEAYQGNTSMKAQNMKAREED